MAPLEKSSSTMSEFMLKFNLAEAIDRMSMPPEEVFAMLRGGLESEEPPGLVGAMDYLLPTAPSSPLAFDALDSAVANQGGGSRNRNGERKHRPQEVGESSTLQSTATTRQTSNQPETVSSRMITRSASARDLQLIGQSQPSTLNGEYSRQNGGAHTSTRSMTGMLFALGHNALPPQSLNQHLEGRASWGWEGPSNKRHGFSREIREVPSVHLPSIASHAVRRREPLMRSASAGEGNLEQGSWRDLGKHGTAPNLDVGRSSGEKLSGSGTSTLSTGRLRRR
ncbi:hypothetical protein C8F04DRAFT_1230802 [Mycena alexandri]|uniref:Uncharacterized protein n=1 Tax=Mycena alexandri TaxID=1745969 RepID=A0AAD6X8N5_9AGAR|nr:hypothetical protein C8F04DRAFT_1230802 [Mycena alexandri]